MKNETQKETIKFDAYFGTVLTRAEAVANDTQRVVKIYAHSETDDETLNTYSRFTFDDVELQPRDLVICHVHPVSDTRSDAAQAVKAAAEKARAGGQNNDRLTLFGEIYTAAQQYLGEATPNAANTGYFATVELLADFAFAEMRKSRNFAALDAVNESEPTAQLPDSALDEAIKELEKTIPGITDKANLFLSGSEFYSGMPNEVFEYMSDHSEKYEKLFTDFAVHQIADYIGIGDYESMQSGNDAGNAASIKSIAAPACPDETKNAIGYQIEIESKVIRERLSDLETLQLHFYLYFALDYPRRHKLTPRMIDVFATRRQMLENEIMARGEDLMQVNFGHLFYRDADALSDAAPPIVERATPDAENPAILCDQSRCRRQITDWFINLQGYKFCSENCLQMYNDEFPPQIAAADKSENFASAQLVFGCAECGGSTRNLSLTSSVRFPGLVFCSTECLENAGATWIKDKNNVENI